MLEYQLFMGLRVLLAAILGGLIGLERESLNKAAGFRTHTLVCLGSCLIMITSIEMNATYGTGADPARLAAQVVSGIGFLGAGTILHSGFGIKGLTTAASLWVVAAIGLAIGAGQYITAIFTTVIVFIILVYFGGLEEYVKTKQKKLKKIEILIADRPGQLGRVTSALGEMEIHIRKVEMSDPLDNLTIKLNIICNIPYNTKLSNVKERIEREEGVYDAHIC
ncbi:MAG: methyltransferase [Firmicutes bacterium HGW-Firmicutes-12]|jgi:putative Mg2+ transporter-C (MgtC) family protein|nr:MAG: methyltransferase [Firmicutes bacterium HGW-Firmicutes-12]